MRTASNGSAMDTRLITRGRGTSDSQGQPESSRRKPGWETTPSPLFDRSLELRCVFSCRHRRRCSRSIWPPNNACRECLLRPMGINMGSIPAMVFPSHETEILLARPTDADVLRRNSSCCIPTGTIRDRLFIDEWEDHLIGLENQGKRQHRHAVCCWRSFRCCGDLRRRLMAPSDAQCPPTFFALLLFF